MVPWNCPLPLFIEPLGAVDKATPPWWRLILDASLSNEFQDAWGVWYFSVSQLAALLDVCDIMFAEDLEDAYHLSIFFRLHRPTVLVQGLCNRREWPSGRPVAARHGLRRFFVPRPL